ncbi:MAG: hypothetical protein JWL59_480 [Chthoniobacteraceae bacterium]|nr:hypothetical protein [Chthoniobacteraceae bacterium]
MTPRTKTPDLSRAMAALPCGKAEFLAKKPLPIPSIPQSEPVDRHPFASGAGIIGLRDPANSFS